MRSLVLAFFVLSLTVAACGSESESSDEGDDFLTQINSICDEQTRKFIDTNLELGYATEREELVEYTQNLVDVRSETSARIEELEPSEGDAEAFDDLLAALEDAVTASEDRVAAVEEGDEAAATKAVAASAEAIEKENEISAELGAEVCDNELPGEDARAAEGSLREFATTSDPATSCTPGELVTEIFVESGFGGVEACEKEQEALQKNPEDLPEDVSVDKVTGVDGLAAVIEFEDVGGMFDGEPARATLYNLQGGWQLFEIAPVE